MSEVSQPNLIETIEEALKKATPGEWYVHEDEESTCIMAIDPNNPGRSESVFGLDPEINYTSEDALLIANAPEWLRALLEENKRITKQLSDSIDETVTFAKEIYRLNTELEQVKAERDKWKTGHSSRSLRIVEAEEAIESLRTELSAKDKVLEWYGEQSNHWIGWKESEQTPFAHIDEDSGDRARSILSQYRGETHD